MGIYYFGMRNNSTPQATINSTSPTPIPTATEVEKTTELTDLSYAYMNGTLYMKYKDEVYEKKSDYDTEIVSTPGSITWIDLPGVRPIPSDASGYNGLFDFKAFSKDTFAFIMRWDGDSYVYYYNNSNNSDTLKEVVIFKNNETGYKVPKFNLTHEALNKDGKLIVLDMFACWACGGHIPITTIIEISTGEVQTIGETSAFNWLEDSKYQYKLSKLIPCNSNLPEDRCYPTYEKPEKLPYIQGTFQ